MSEFPKSQRFMIFVANPKIEPIKARLTCYASIIVAILGIISAATHNELGLGSVSWFLLSIFLVLWALVQWFIGYFAAKEGFIK